ncbi:MAG: glycosyltransferase [Candidatus Omnitrophica bacterium]|nr:glycosyltransferase [Candidatus Omnitrophota bacterium]
MKVSIITVCLNSKDTIEDTIQSVLSQSYHDVDHVIVDGGSTDGTLDIINKYRDDLHQIISEKDDGIYYAMNKGVSAARGEIVGCLNSDDQYADDTVIENVVRSIAENNTDSCYGDMIYIDKDHSEKIVRYWKAGKFNRNKFKWGWMPPHPTFFVKKDVYEKFGLFDTNFPITSDYELMLRFLYKHNISTTYIPRVMVRMRVHGSSHPSFSKTSKNIVANYRAWKVNDLSIIPLMMLFKPLSKISQFKFRNNLL